MTTIYNKGYMAKKNPRPWTPLKHPFSIRLSPLIHNELLRISCKEKISMNKLIESLIVKSLNSK